MGNRFHCIKWIIGAGVILGIVALFPVPIPAFSYQITDQMEGMTEKEISDQINKDLAEAHKEQIEEGQKRYEARMEDKKGVLEEMRQDAEHIRSMIREARMAREKREATVERTSRAALFVTVMGVLIIVGLFFHRRWRVVEVADVQPQSKYRSHRRKGLTKRDEALQLLEKSIEESLKK